MPTVPLLRLLATMPVVVCAQTTIVNYTFEGTTTAVVGSAISTVSWNSGGAESYVSTLFASQAQALSVGNFQIGEYYQITLNATGYSDLVLNAFRTNASGDAAPRDWKISYSLTGISGSYTDVATYTLSKSTAVPATTIPGFSLPAGANNNASIVLRLLVTSSTRIDGASAANGTVRLDNISFTGTAIPEPSTYAALAGLAALALHLWRRRARPGARNSDS